MRQADGFRIAQVGAAVQTVQVSRGKHGAPKQGLLTHAGKADAGRTFWKGNQKSARQGGQALGWEGNT